MILRVSFFTILTDIVTKLPLYPQNHVGCLLRNHDYRRVGIAQNDLGHDRRTDDAQTVETVHTQFLVDYRRIIVAHLAGTSRVINGLAVAARCVEQFIIALKFPPGKVFIFKAR